MKKVNVIFAFLMLLATLTVVRCIQSANGTPNETKTTTTDVQIPALLDRNESLRYGKEWDDIQNFYGIQKSELQRKPGQMEPYIKLAELFCNEARITGEHPYYYPAAMQMLEQVTQSLSTKTNLTPQEKDQYFRALSTTSGVQLSLHDFQSALETAQKAVAINPYNAQIYGAIVDAYVELGQYDNAVAMADKMVSIRPDLRSYSRVSYLREIHGDIKGSIEAMDMAVKAGYPGLEQTEWARLQLGGLLERYGDLNTAKEVYTQCLDARPDYPFALEALARVDIANKDYKDAETKLNKAIAIIPEVGFYTLLAELYAMTDRQKEADALKPTILDMIAEDMEKGHKMELELASIYTDIFPDYVQALKYATVEYHARPENIDVNRQLAMTYTAMGNREKAQEHLEKASKTKSQHPELKKIKKSL